MPTLIELHSLKEDKNFRGYLLEYLEDLEERLSLRRFIKDK